MRTTNPQHQPMTPPTGAANLLFLRILRTRADKSLRGILTIKPVRSPSGIPMRPPTNAVVRIPRVSSRIAEAQKLASIPPSHPIIGPNKPPTNKATRISLYRGGLVEADEFIATRAEHPKYLSQPLRIVIMPHMSKK